MSKEEPARRYALYIPTIGKRRPGRPRTSYLNYVQRLLGDNEGAMPEQQIAAFADDRCAWRNLVVACSAADGWWWPSTATSHLPNGVTRNEGKWLMREKASKSPQCTYCHPPNEVTRNEMKWPIFSQWSHKKQNEMTHIIYRWKTSQCTSETSHLPNGVTRNGLKWLMQGKEVTNYS